MKILFAILILPAIYGICRFIEYLNYPYDYSKRQAFYEAEELIQKFDKDVCLYETFDGKERIVKFTESYIIDRYRDMAKKDIVFKKSAKDISDLYDLAAFSRDIRLHQKDFENTRFTLKGYLSYSLPLLSVWITPIPNVSYSDNFFDNMIYNDMDDFDKVPINYHIKFSDCCFCFENSEKKIVDKARSILADKKRNTFFIRVELSCKVKVINDRELHLWDVQIINSNTEGLIL